MEYGIKQFEELFAFALIFSKTWASPRRRRRWVGPPTHSRQRTDRHVSTDATATGPGCSPLPRKKTSLKYNAVQYNLEWKMPMTPPQSLYSQL